MIIMRVSMMISRRHMLQATIGVMLAPASVVDVFAASTYPSRPVRVLVPYAPGGPADIIGRLVAEKLSDALGKHFYVENVGGAGGNIGMGQGARSPGDGYTVLVVPPNVVVNPALYQTVPYDPYRDFEPITIAVTSPTVLTVNPTLDVASVEDLVALVKSSAGKFSFASPGTGTPPHLIGEYFRQSLGLDLVHVPFNSAGQAVASTLAGHTPIAFTSLPPAVPLIRDGKLKALAVTSHTRSTALPDVPSMAEQGFPEIEGEGWFAFMVPASTPHEIVELLHGEIVKVLALPELKAQFAALGFATVGNSPEQAVAVFNSESEKWSRVIRAAGLHAD
jgi:tripartite-type tricarboxylate transporter receptor subunit TctC